MNIPKFASIILLALFALTMSKDATKEARVDIFDDCPGSVDGFILVDSDLDRDLGPLPNILDWADLTPSPKALSIRANITECEYHSIQSILMTLDGLEYCAPFPFAVAPVDTPLNTLPGDWF